MTTLAPPFTSSLESNSLPLEVPANTASSNTLNFEAALAELETLVRKLEEGRMPLEESIKTYERGIFLKNHCDAQLKSAQLKIEEVMASAEAK